MIIEHAAALISFVFKIGFVGTLFKDVQYYVLEIATVSGSNRCRVSMIRAYLTGDR